MLSRLQLKQACTLVLELNSLMLCLREMKRCEQFPVANGMSLVRASGIAHWGFFFYLLNIYTLC